MGGGYMLWHFFLPMEQWVSSYMKFYYGVLTFVMLFGALQAKTWLDLCGFAVIAFVAGSRAR